MRFKKGDRVRVISDISCHDVKIGTEIVIHGIDHDDEDYYEFYKDSSSELYFISDEEVEPIELTFTQQQMIDFAQSLLKDYTTQEVTLETLNKFLENDK